MYVGHHVVQRSHPCSFLFLQCNPAESLKMFVPHCCHAINQIAVRKCKEKILLVKINF